MEKYNGKEAAAEVRLVKRGEPGWPERLRHLPGMPAQLYYIGSLPDDGTPAVGIIGSRACSPYGHRMAVEFGKSLASAGIQIISGMAVGVDGYAQEGALMADGRSFAILGSGVDVCYPPGNRPLYEQLPRKGGLIAEVPPGSQPLRQHFASRNRIISAFSDILLVIEARKKSGTNITVEFALQQGKTVYALPGRVGDPLSDGCNLLISQGAGIACSPESILGELITARDTVSFTDSLDRLDMGRRILERRAEADPTLSQEARHIYRRLSFTDPLTADDLSQKLSLPIPELITALTDLILGGYVQKSPEGGYLRTPV